MHQSVRFVRHSSSSEAKIALFRRWHLSGHDAEGQPFVAGIYPLLQDETCFFLAVDFNKAGWSET